MSIFWSDWKNSFKWSCAYKSRKSKSWMYLPSQLNTNFWYHEDRFIAGCYWPINHSLHSSSTWWYNKYNFTFFITWNGNCPSILDWKILYRKSLARDASKLASVNSHITKWYSSPMNPLKLLLENWTILIDLNFHE